MQDSDFYTSGIVLFNKFIDLSFILDKKIEYQVVCDEDLNNRFLP